MPVPIDHAHLTTEHVAQLREVLDTGVSKELTNLRRLTGPGRYRVSRVVRDSAELQHLKTTPAPCNTGVPDKEGTRAFPFDRDRDAQHQGCADRE